MEGPGSEETKPHRKTCLIWCVRAVWGQILMNPQQTLVAANTSWHKACPSPLRTRSGTPELYLVSIVHQVLANNFGVYVGKAPVRRVHGPHAGGTPRAHPGISLRRDALVEMRAELNATRHTAS